MLSFTQGIIKFELYNTRGTDINYQFLMIDFFTILWGRMVVYL